MPTPVLQIIAQELKAAVNPLGAPELLQIGDAPGKMSEADAEALLTREEQGILSALPELFARVVDGYSDGEILTGRQYGAAGGERDLKLAFTPVLENSLLLYKNYSNLKKPWASRRRVDAMPVAGHTLDKITGVVTLETALLEGEEIYACYQHTGQRAFAGIRNLVLRSARAELYEMFPHWNGAEEVIRVARELVENQLMAWQANGRGIREIDRVEYVIESRSGTPGVNNFKMPFMGGRG